VLSKLHRQAPVQAPLHPHPTPAQPRSNIAAPNLIDLPPVADRVVGGHHPFFHVTQDRRQVVLSAQAPMGIGRVRRHRREAPVPQRQILPLQVGIRFFEARGLGQASPFTSRSWAVPKKRSMRPLACGECAAIQPIPSSRKARPICVSSSSTASSAASGTGAFSVNRLLLSV